MTRVPTLGSIPAIRCFATYLWVFPTVRSPLERITEEDGVSLPTRCLSTKSTNQHTISRTSFPQLNHVLTSTARARYGLMRQRKHFRGSSECQDLLI
jgi:hypothetical protein